MNKRPFKADHWFFKDNKAVATAKSLPHSDSEPTVTVPVFPNFKNMEMTIPQTNNNTINKFFTPGWKGESLICKEVKKFNKILDSISSDVEESFRTLGDLNKKFKSAIFDEFMSFAEYKALNCTQLDDYNSFWKELKNENSPYRESLDQFIKIYSFRIAAIFILKIRFISILLKKTKQNFNMKSLVYPNSYLTSIFQKGSSRELKAMAIEQNIFSWYKPSDVIHTDLTELYEISDQLSITEIIKNTSQRSQELLNIETAYSHSISHKNFGLFLNSLLINFPLWLNTFNHRFNSPYRLSNDGMEVISCKYEGDYLESLSLSHWLAQENNKYLKWEQILCPDFKGTNFETGLYMKIINELQFLAFLAQIANEQGRDCVEFVAKVINGHLLNRKNSNTNQKNLLFNDLSLNPSTYDRIIINSIDAPKNNVQHYLINAIQQNANDLKENGLVYLITHKKLFVPSQKTKLDTFLKKFKLEGVFDFEQVKGKGEVGSYIYIFSKVRSFTLQEYVNKKQTCFNFRFKGELETFQFFNYYTLMIQNFFFGNLNDVPPMYHKEMSGFELEFFQDAIVDGRLMHSSSKDSSKITHPMFFNGLIKLCHPFDYYFDIQSVDFNFDTFQSKDMLNLNPETYRSHAPFVAIVDARAKDKSVNIEIINYQALEAKAYEYGQSMCSYFEITPKWNTLSLDAIKEFLETPIGKQIIDLTFNNETRKMKANLSKLLIPKFFIQQGHIPEHIEAGVKLLKMETKELLTLHPTQIDRDFKNIEKLIFDIAKHYPAQISNYIAVFKRNMTICLEQLGLNNSRSLINYSNPILKTPLLLSKTRPIYPQNEDIFIEFNIDHSVKLIHANLEKVVQKSVENDGVKTYGLELHAQGQLIITMYSDIEMIKFLEFILANVKGAPISKILQGIQVPNLVDLKNIMQSFNGMKRILMSISDRLPQIFERIISQSITRN